jgi:putative transposase
VRSVERKKIRRRVPQSQAVRPNQCWSAEFVSDKLTDGRNIRILTVIDQFTRQCAWLETDRSMNCPKVVLALNRAIAERTAPDSSTLDNGSEFAGRVMEAWAIETGVQLCFIHPGRPVENGFIESFNGRLRDGMPECRIVPVVGGRATEAGGVARELQPISAAAVSGILCKRHSWVSG